MATTEIIFTNGCFDILHVGHVRLLQFCKSLTGRVVVGLNSDASVKRLKGSERPINNQSARAEVLRALWCVDDVVVFEEDTPYELIKQVKPTIIVKGGDYVASHVVGKDLAQVVIFNYVPGCSTTETIARARNKTQ